MLPPSSGLQAKKPQVPSRWPWRCVVRSSKGLKPGPKVDGNDCESIEINFLLMLWIRRRDNILMMLHHVLRAYSSNTRSLFILSLSLSLSYGIYIYICIIVSYIMYYNVYIYFCWANALTFPHLEMPSTSGRARSGEDLSVSRTPTKTSKSNQQTLQMPEGFPTKKNLVKVWSHVFSSIHLDWGDRNRRRRSEPWRFRRVFFRRRGVGRNIWHVVP